MIKLRPQYHLRRTSVGIDAFDVRRLIELVKGLPVRMIDPRQLVELDEDHRYFHTGDRPTPRNIIEHLRLAQQCDTRYPIILDEDGRVMDGMRRVCKALLEEEARIPAVQFAEDPAPDFVNCDPSMLPYGNS